MPDEKLNDTGDQTQKALFAGLIMMLGSSAMQQLGKLVDPGSGKTEVSLEGAQSTIDLLDMLRAKTQGNLDSDEEKMLRDLLASLQMNYVQVADAMKKKPAAPTPAAPTPAAPTPAAPAAEKSAGAPPDSTAHAEPSESPSSAKAEPETKETREPKFHKSYGA